MNAEAGMTGVRGSCACCVVYLVGNFSESLLF